MPLQGRNRTVVFVAALLFVLLFGFVLRPPAALKQFANDHLPTTPFHQGTNVSPYPPLVSDVTQGEGGLKDEPPMSEAEEEEKAIAEVSSRKHVWIYARMTEDGKGFPLDFHEYQGYNPNMIPHPDKNDTWIVVAQAAKIDGEASLYLMELVCEARFTKGKMQCIKSPLILPIMSAASPYCEGTHVWFNRMVGPHDARVFIGPDNIPYIIYGLPSKYNCLGQYIHDLRRLTPWEKLKPADTTDLFFWPTDIQRPEPRRNLEKNFFAFWDSSGEMYIHYDIAPSRAFAKLKPDGTIERDLAPQAAANDNVCLQKRMPAVRSNGKEHLHQATNSLAITMCKRSEPDCRRTDENTYIFNIFHHKLSYSYDIYEPYVMMFKQTAPFELHGITADPIWIKGRGNWTDDTPARDRPHMVYVTSMSWKQQGLTYHGFLDDEILLAFGIDDIQSGGTDVLAEDLINGLELCK